MTLNEQAQCLIDTHDDEVQAVQESLTNPDSEIDRSAREIIVREKQLSYIVDHLESTGKCPEELVYGLERVRERNAQFTSEFPEDYTALLVTELQDLIDRYPTIVCYAFELEPLDIEVDHDFTTRDSIEILFEWLPDERLPQNATTIVHAIDDVLECKCEMHSSTYRDLSDTLARSHYPSRFWWRHPDQVLVSD